MVSPNTDRRRINIPIDVIFSVLGASMHRITVLNSEGVMLSLNAEVTVIFRFLVRDMGALRKVRGYFWNI